MVKPAEFLTQIDVTDQPRLTAVSIVVAESDLLGLSDDAYKTWFQGVMAQVQEKLQTIRDRDKGDYVPPKPETAPAPSTEVSDAADAK